VSDLSRRSFAESLAVAALAPLIGLRSESIQLTQLGQTFAHPLSEAPSTLAKALAEVVRTRYGSRLSASDLDTITRQIQTGLERVRQLRKVDLTNGDEPDFLFSAVRRTAPSS
jgi:hypothetical protein